MDTPHFERHGERQSLHNTGSAGGGGVGVGGGGGAGPSDGQRPREGMHSKERTTATAAALSARPRMSEAIDVVTVFRRGRLGWCRNKGERGAVL